MPEYLSMTTTVKRLCDSRVNCAFQLRQQISMSLGCREEANGEENGDGNHSTVIPNTERRVLLRQHSAFCNSPHPPLSTDGLPCRFRVEVSTRFPTYHSYWSVSCEFFGTDDETASLLGCVRCGMMGPRLRHGYASTCESVSCTNEKTPYFSLTRIS